MKKLGMNTISNIATKIWSIVSIYLFIPLYINILGETSYGLVSFFATMQTALNILGLGLSNTLRREFAVGENNEKNANRKYFLLRDVEIIYFAIGLFIFLICALGSETISERWLNIEDLDSNMVATVLTLMGASIALQMIANLYAGCLFGLDCQVFANTLCIIWSIAKSLGALIIIAVVRPSLILFYGWHIFTDTCYLLILRKSVISRLELRENPKWKIQDFSLMSRIWKYATGILFISFIALVNKQLDKVIISKYLSLTEFGAYNIATTLGGLCTIIPTALYTTVFPRFTNYATTGNTDKLYQEFKTINKLVGLIISSMGAYIAVYSLPLINIWTRSDSYVGILGSVAFFVVLAVAITEFQEIPYALALANGNTRYNVIVGSAFIPIVFIATYLGITKFGLLGAGVVYLTMMTAQTILYEALVYKRYLNDSVAKIIFRDTILPMIISLLIAFASRAAVSRISKPFIVSIYAMFCGILTLLLLIIFFAKNEIVELLKEKESLRK